MNENKNDPEIERIEKFILNCNSVKELKDSNFYKKLPYQLQIYSLHKASEKFKDYHLYLLFGDIDEIEVLIQKKYFIDEIKGDLEEYGDEKRIIEYLNFRLTNLKVKSILDENSIENEDKIDDDLLSYKMGYLSDLLNKFGEKVDFERLKLFTNNASNNSEIDETNNDKYKPYNFKISETLKIRILHEFGIIDYLDNLWHEKNIQKSKSDLIALLIDAKPSTIHSRLSGIDSKQKTLNIETNTETILDEYNLTKGFLTKGK